MAVEYLVLTSNVGLQVTRTSSFTMCKRIKSVDIKQLPSVFSVLDCTKLTDVVFIFIV